MTALHISLENAKQDKLFYFVPTVVVYRASDARCLILKRHEREVAAPGKWALCGGKLEWKDYTQQAQRGIIEALLAREVAEESGLTIEDRLTYIASVGFVRPDGVPVITPVFAATYKSGDVQIEEHSFTDHAWVNAEEIKNYDCIGGVPDEVTETIRLMSK